MKKLPQKNPFRLYWNNIRGNVLHNNCLFTVKIHNRSKSTKTKSPIKSWNHLNVIRQNYTRTFAQITHPTADQVLGGVTSANRSNWCYTDKTFLSQRNQWHLSQDENKITCNFILQNFNLLVDLAHKALQTLEKKDFQVHNYYGCPKAIKTANRMSYISSDWITNNKKWHH